MGQDMWSAPRPQAGLGYFAHVLKLSLCPSPSSLCHGGKMRGPHTSPHLGGPVLSNKGGLATAPSVMKCSRLVVIK